MEQFDYVVLGAGLGGLSAAACLASQGNRVAVLEQHYLPGGCCHTFSYGDYSFCADVHYIYQCGKGQTVDQFLNYIEREVPFKSEAINLIPNQVGLKRIGFRTALPNLFLVGASAGYPSVPGVISNGMCVVEMITGKSVYRHGERSPAFA